MRLTVIFSVALAGGMLFPGAVVTASEGPTILLRADFDEGDDGGFVSEYGGKLTVVDDEYSQGRYALRDACDAGVNDVERYLKFTDADTKLGFHFKADGVGVIRVLARSVEDNENLYVNLADVPQRVWSWRVVRIADLRNVIPPQGPPEAPLGDKTGRGKTFRNLVFHLMGLDKLVDQPTVHLDNIVLYSGADTQPPVLTGAPRLITHEGGQLLVWPDAKDDVGVAYYRVARGGRADFAFADAAMVAQTVIPEFAPDGSGGFYRVVAVDYDGNAGAPSDAVEVPAAP